MEHKLLFENWRKFIAESDGFDCAAAGQVYAGMVSSAAQDELNDKASEALLSHAIRKVNSLPSGLKKKVFLLLLKTVGKRVFIMSKDDFNREIQRAKDAWSKPAYDGVLGRFGFGPLNYLVNYANPNALFKNMVQDFFDDIQDIKREYEQHKAANARKS